MQATTLQLHCRSCSATILAEDVHLGNGMAKCRACNAVFRFLGESNDGPARPKEPVAQPDSVTVEDHGHWVTFTHRWFSRTVVGIVLFSIFWDGLLIVWYRIALTGDAPLAAHLAPLLHVAVGIWLTYYAIAGFVNSTTVRLSRETLAIEHGPLPWPGARRIGTDALRQLYCEERVRHGRHGRKHIRYDLMALLQDGSRQKLITGLESPDVAIYLEQRLEDWLGIRDQRVAQEYEG